MNRSLMMPATTNATATRMLPIPSPRYHRFKPPGSSGWLVIHRGYPASKPPWVCNPHSAVAAERVNNTVPRRALVRPVHVRSGRERQEASALLQGVPRRQKRGHHPRPRRVDIGTPFIHAHSVGRAGWTHLEVRPTAIMIRPMHIVDMMKARVNGTFLSSPGSASPVNAATNRLDIQVNKRAHSGLFAATTIPAIINPVGDPFIVVTYLAATGPTR